MRVSIMGLAFSAALCAAFPVSADQPLGVAMNLGFPTPVQMFAGGDVDATRTQDVTASYDLTDLTDEAITLTSNNDCESHAWSVTDATGTVVDSSGVCPQIVQPVTLNIPIGTAVSAQNIVSLHVFDYKEGQTYTMHYKAFGVEGTADFQVSFLK